LDFAAVRVRRGFSARVIFDAGTAAEACRPPPAAQSAEAAPGCSWRAGRSRGAVGPGRPAEGDARRVGDILAVRPRAARPDGDRPRGARSALPPARRRAAGDAGGAESAPRPRLHGADGAQPAPEVRGIAPEGD